VTDLATAVPEQPRVRLARVIRDHIVQLRHRGAAEDVLRPIEDQLHALDPAGLSERRPPRR
jgi:hypothetical protein